MCAVLSVWMEYAHHTDLHKTPWRKSLMYAVCMQEYMIWFSELFRNARKQVYLSCV